MPSSDGSSFAGSPAMYTAKVPGSTPSISNAVTE